MTDTNVPAELSYTPEHEWVRKVGPTTVRVGITDYAQGQLGDVVFVQLPEIDSEVEVGELLFDDLERQVAIALCREHETQALTVGLTESPVARRGAFWRDKPFGFEETDL